MSKIKRFAAQHLAPGFFDLAGFCENCQQVVMGRLRLTWIKVPIFTMLATPAALIGYYIGSGNPARSRWEWWGWDYEPWRPIVASGVAMFGFMLVFGMCVVSTARHCRQCNSRIRLED